MRNLRLYLSITILSLLMLGGCATKVPQYDYAAFMKAKPKTLLVLPPLNDSPEVKATASMWSHATLPLSEAGYYVLPVTLVDETLKQNGVFNASDAQAISAAKLHEVFGADAAVYIKVTKYGTSFQVLASETRIEAEGRIVDLRTGDLLWHGNAVASSAEEGQQNQGGLAGLLIAAVVKQIIGTATDAAYKYGGIASNRLLGTPHYNGILPGPRSPFYGQPPAAQ